MMEKLRKYIAEVPNFPKPGILFRDIAPLLRYKFRETIDAISLLFSTQEWSAIDLVAGIESRGFLFAAPLAYNHNKGVVKIRKAGKLPKAAGQISYGLEYGTSILEMQQGNGMRLLIVDDLLATGGSLYAAAELAKQVGYDVAAFATLINLTALNSFQWQGIACRSVIHY
ncbi:MAG: adenine phosphoribosyltransferase [Proteobacteria bacterium]|nr:adenine phosphoribosyltransferase [Pseudomonadota bacterium]